MSQLNWQGVEYKKILLAKLEHSLIHTRSGHIFKIPKNSFTAHSLFRIIWSDVRIISTNISDQSINLARRIYLPTYAKRSVRFEHFKKTQKKATMKREKAKTHHPKQNQRQKLPPHLPLLQKRSQKLRSWVRESVGHRISRKKRRRYYIVEGIRL